MIWDCFMFGGEREYDLLELRLRTLAPRVDRFVMAEATVTFQGTPKPLAWPPAGRRFARWADRVVHVPVKAGDLPDGEDPWAREYALRDKLLIPLHESAGPGDTVLMGDLDEIPDLAGWRPGQVPQVWLMHQHVFAVDWLSPVALLGTLAVPWQLQRDDPQCRTWKAARAWRHKFAQVRGGWHFSWLGGPAAIDAKCRAHCHTELNQQILDLNARGKLYEGGWVPWDRRQQHAVRVDGSWPEWISSMECPPSWFRPR